MPHYPRTLIITHNSFDDHKNNGKTLNTLFDGWDPDAIAQLFFLAEEPTSKYCKKYFRITDRDVVRAIFRLNGNKSCGQVVSNKDPGVTEASQVHKTSFFSFTKQISNGIPARILRDLLWSTKVWKTKALIDWLKEFNPEVIFWGVGNSKFSADIAYWISCFLKIPLCLYYGDDYVLHSNYGGLLSRIQHKRIKSFHDRNLHHATKLIAIGDQMASEYRAAYNKDVVVVRTSVNNPDPLPPIEKRADEPIVLSYLGGLHLNRWKSLIELGDLLHETELAHGINTTLNIWSMDDISPAMSARLNRSPLRFCGKALGKQVDEIMQRSDILVHVESSEKKYRKLTSLSISTKIPEYLSMGKCILCYGPDEVASIRLITENNVGFALTGKDDHNKKLSILAQILSDRPGRDLMGGRARDFAREKFSRTANAETLRLTLLECVQPGLII